MQRLIRSSVFGTFMDMLSGGIDVFYIDESHDLSIYVVSALAVPMLRPNDRGFCIAWADIFKEFKSFRRRLQKDHKIPITKELHGVKLASGRGNYLKGKYGLTRGQAATAYKYILSSLDFIPDASIMSVMTNNSDSIYGNVKLELCLYKLFQRMRLQCKARNTNAIVFFDEGHPEYRSLYRQAQRWLPTGSRLGSWSTGKKTQNLPLDMFFKDGNDKQSRNCFFTQTVDLIAYSAFLKCKGEAAQLTDWQSQYGLGLLYDSIPAKKLNSLVQARRPRDGIVRP